MTTAAAPTRFGTLTENLTPEDLEVVKTDGEGNTYNRYDEIINGKDGKFYYDDCIKSLRTTQAIKLAFPKEEPTPRDEDQRREWAAKVDAGTAMHKTIENYLRLAGDDDVGKLLLTKTGYDDEFGITHLKPWLQQLCDEHDEVKVHELEVLLELSSYMIKGSADAILFVRGMGYVIADWKRSPDRNIQRYSLASYTSQLYLYRLMLAASKGIVASTLFLVSIHPDNVAAHGNPLVQYRFNAVDTSLPLSTLHILRTARAYMIGVRAADAEKRAKRALLACPRCVHGLALLEKEEEDGASPKRLCLSN